MTRAARAYMLVYILIHFYIYAHACRIVATLCPDGDNRALHKWDT